MKHLVSRLLLEHVCDPQTIYCILLAGRKTEHEVIYRLRHLNVCFSLSFDCNVLKKFKNLRTLNIRMRKSEIESGVHLNLKHIAALKSVPNLQTLKLKRIVVTDVAPLQALADLRNLCLTRVTVSDLYPLQSLVNLQILDVSSTH
eukprot:Awhi_evm1s127